MKSWKFMIFVEKWSVGNRFGSVFQDIRRPGACVRSWKRLPVTRNALHATPDDWQSCVCADIIIRNQWKLMEINENLWKSPHYSSQGGWWLTSPRWRDGTFMVQPPRKSRDLALKPLKTWHCLNIPKLAGIIEIEFLEVEVEIPEIWFLVLTLIQGTYSFSDFLFILTSA